MRAFIIFRDRVTYARLCTAALLAADLDVCVVDHGSTWPGAVRWLECLESATCVQVLRRGGGNHPQSLWGWEPFREACGSGRYVVTDPDVVPSEDCPAGWPGYLSGLLDEYPDTVKAGLGLRLDRIPAHYQRREEVLAWEQQFCAATAWRADGVYAAAVDTTLALYRPLAEVPGFRLKPALRTGPPYMADHLAWHEDLSDLTPELGYYYARADPGTQHWTLGAHP